MNSKHSLKLALMAISAVGVGAPQLLAAQTPSPAPEALAPTIAGWPEFVEALRVLPDRLLAKLPEPLRKDPQIQQEVARLILESLTASSIDAISGDGDHPAFLPQLNQTLNIGQPNADTNYRMARITPGGTYRLRGGRGTLRIATIGQVGPTPGEPGAKAQPGPTRVYDDLNTLHTDKKGRFDVLLSPSKPAGYKGDWWQLEPTANKLLLRLVSSNWGVEHDPTISIERVDGPLEKPRTPAADLEQRLRRLPGAAGFMSALFVDHVTKLREQGYVNKLKVLDVSQMGGLTGQFYYEGAYELANDEALIVEATVPPKCAYRSLILTNEIYETTDWYDNHSSLNDTQTDVDKDGILRIVVSAHDPGVRNWLDTAGYARGAVQGRWTGCETQPVPTVRKVAFAEVRSALPPETRYVTPEQRREVISKRRLALQERPLW